MIKEKPFIHLFKSPYNYYLFDVNTNSIIRINKDTYDYLHKQQQGRQLKLSKNIEIDIIELKKNGYLSSNRPKEMIHSQDEHMEYQLNNRVAKMTLQVTQGCNFRCSYCIYSEADNELQRSHTNKKMTFDIARKAIDFLLEHSIDEKSINIGFYGGEPLLEFPLIKKCIEYAEEIGEGKKIAYSITTNGSILTKEIIELFVKYQVSVLVSLDGPKSIHDKHRIFAANGCGTFDSIQKNIDHIKVKYPEFLKNISFTIVVNPQDDFSTINNFFMKYKYEFMDASIRSSTIDDIYSDEKITYTHQYIQDSQYEVFKVLLNSIGELDRKYVSPIAAQEYDRVTAMKKRLGTFKKLPNKMSHSGPCIPGQLRLFVNADGDFFPCERVSENSEIMNIGNIYDGFNYEKARALLNIASLTENECKQCWAINNCTLCAKYADNGDYLCGDKLLSYCDTVKKEIEKIFKYYVALNELQSNKE